ncbi:MAG: RpiB/LacA/LacB family sugar-phosphate isomerase [Mycoplasma sp.]
MTSLITIKNSFKNADIIELEYKNKCDIRTFQNLESELEYIKNNQSKFDRIVFINEDAIIPFMYFSKQKGIVAAAIYDEHSAMMTPSHNNTKIMCLGYEISTPTLINSMISLYLNTPYEGARHKSRIDMLDAELERE